MAPIFAAADAAFPLLGPSLYGPTPQSVHIWWHTAEEHAEHRVEYGLDPAALDEVRLEAATRYPVLKLENLQPGAEYHYRIASGSWVGELHRFRLPDPESPFRLALWGDNQRGWEVFQGQTVPALQAAAPDLLITVGDLVQTGRNYEEWEPQLYGPARELLRTIPWYPVRGNHDYSGGAEVALQMLPLPQTNHWYAKTYGPIRLLALNTNLRDRAQIEWMEAEMQRPEWRDAAYRLVVCHHPPFTSWWDNPNYDGDALMRALAVPLFEKYGADVVLTGHAHAYERLGTRRADGREVHYVILGGGGGPLDTVEVYPWPHSRIKRSTFHIVIAEVQAERMVWQALDTTTGRSFDLFMIEPNRPTAP
jgi:acid phosphatase type 7